jgi:hypothetical protein
MGAGIFNVIIGLLAVAGGLSGRFALIGTQSTGLLVAFGVALAIYGGYQIVRARRGS